MKASKMIEAVLIVLVWAGCAWAGERIWVGAEIMSRCDESKTETHFIVPTEDADDVMIAPRGTKAGRVRVEVWPAQRDLDKKVTEALEKALKHLNKSTTIGFYNPIYRTPADQLRLEADRIEQRDRDIEYIKKVYELWKESLRRQVCE